MAIIKKHLDFLYDMRTNVLQDLETTKEEGKAPSHQCCENMVSNNKHIDLLKEQQKRLDGIDKIITHYIESNNGTALK